MMLQKSLALLAACYCTAAVAQQASAEQPTVTLSAATLRGTQTSLPSATQAVNKYLGVPFAVSPPQRFSPAQPLPDSDRVIDVKEWKPACFQEFISPLAGRLITEAIFNQPPPAEDEDCLYLNVYTPASAPPEGGRAVMFWIFGGAFTFGHAGQPLYDGSAFAAFQDVIVVAANYRTNVFGFPNSPQLDPSERNLGLMDQRLALQWVQDNIQAFGGDPKQVTIFGESAGGSSVDIHLTSYTTDTAPFRAAIAESGQFSYQPQNYTGDLETWTALVNGLNCAGASDELQCVRDADARDIKTVIQDSKASFYPQPDDVTLMANPALRRQSGNFARVPVLGGTNANEGRVYTVGMLDESAFLQKMFPGLTSLINGVQQFYSGLFGGNAYYRIAQIYTDYGFLCPQGLWANATVAQNVPTWLYMYNSSFPNTAFLNPSGDSGVWHSSEISTVFSSYPGGPINPNPLLPFGLLLYNLPATDEQRQLSSFVNKAWADFAKNPTQGPGWKSVGDGTMGVLGRGSQGNTGVVEVSQGQMHSQCLNYVPAYQIFSPNAQNGLVGGDEATETSGGGNGGNGGSGGSGGSGSGGSGGSGGGNGGDTSPASRHSASFGALVAALGLVIFAGLKV